MSTNRNPYVFQSQRLNFYRFHQNDALDIFDLNNDEEVMRYTGDIPFKSLNEAILFCGEFGWVFQ